jgi:hypothetical protein
MCTTTCIKVSAAEAVNLSSLNPEQIRVAMPAIHYVVPNIVHFIWFSNSDDRQMTFLNYISVRSAHQIQKPDQIMLHCNRLPSGEWWERLWHEVEYQTIF